MRVYSGGGDEMEIVDIIEENLVEDIYYIAVLSYALEFSYEKYGVLKEV